MLIKPVITEKTAKEAAGKRYTFVVETAANKTEIKKEVEKMFGVKVIKIQTSRVPGKKYRSGKKWIFRYKPEWKKATVTIKPDQKIELFEKVWGAKAA